jgi:hypothetical protein
MTHKVPVTKLVKLPARCRNVGSPNRSIPQSAFAPEVLETRPKIYILNANKVFVEPANCIKIAFETPKHPGADSMP